MSSWSFETTHGHIDEIRPSLGAIASKRGSVAPWLLIAETGVLLNEPEESLVAPIVDGATPPEVIARIAHVVSWFFGNLETEIDHHFRWNYLRLSFVNSRPVNRIGEHVGGRMTTNDPELPPPSEQPPGLVLSQFVKALSMCFAHMRASVEMADWETESRACDWVTITMSKAE